MIVRRLAPGDAEAFCALRMAGLRERPDAFGSSPDEDLARDVEDVRARFAPDREDAVFGAFDGDALVGVAGIHRAGNTKARHQAHVWGMYVAPGARGRGAGEALMRAVVAHGRAMPDVAWLQLGVGADNREARALYERMGFIAWGLEVDALRVGDEPVDELHMRLGLEDERPAPVAPGAGPLIGHCLCGGVRFEVGRVLGPLELCHCPRCRRVSGSAFVAGLMVETASYRMTEGRELVRRFALPVREVPPGYATCFCERCGSPVPPPEPEGEAFEIPAGLLEGDPGLAATRHIFVEHRAPWWPRGVLLPELDRAAVIRLRFGKNTERS